MFLKTNLLNRLMKQAYAGGGLVVARRGDWIYLCGSYWEAEAEKKVHLKKDHGRLDLPDRRASGRWRTFPREKGRETRWKLSCRWESVQTFLIRETA